MSLSVFGDKMVGGAVAPKGLMTYADWWGDLGLLAIGLKFGPSGKNLVELVIEGQYVVSNTHCPALHDCDLEWREAGKQGSDLKGDEAL